MPLMWDIRNTELGKEIDSETCEEFSTIVFSLVGMDVLNIKGDGYTPTLEWFELDKKTAHTILAKLGAEWENDKTAQEELAMYRRLIPKMIGGLFKRSEI